MKKTIIYLLIILGFIQCRKESDDCHFFVTIKNNSDKEIIFFTSAEISYLNTESCKINEPNIKYITSSEETRYQPYPYPDCIERAIIIDRDTLISNLYIVDINKYTTETFPCSEFKERNKILRTYVLTLEDLERMDYTINYPEDASIVVD